MTLHPLPLVLVDCESFGLNTREDHMVELGLVTVDPVTLEPINMFQSLVLNHDSHKKAVLLRNENVGLGDDKFVKETHTKNGLLDALLIAGASGSDIYSPEQVERLAIQWLKGELSRWQEARVAEAQATVTYGNTELQHSQLRKNLDRILGEKNLKPYMTGSSVDFDKNLILTWMPNLWEMFHYRMHDISSMKIEVELSRPLVAKHLPTPRKLHRVIADIFDTLNEYKVYRKYCFTPDKNGF